LLEKQTKKITDKTQAITSLPNPRHLLAACMIFLVLGRAMRIFVRGGGRALGTSHHLTISINKDEKKGRKSNQNQKARSQIRRSLLS
jgi:hypothetical protein